MRRAAIDIGGTFTDLVFWDDEGERILVHKLPSTPDDPARAGLDGLGELVQGALEGSNVNVVEEMVSMIETQRAYEMNSKAISTSDQMLAYLNNNL